MMEDRQTKVLLIEDDPGDARMIAEMLSDSEVGGTLFDVENADRLSAGLTRIQKGGIDAILLDLGLPDSSGLDTFEKVRDQAPEVPIVMLTGLGDTELALEGMSKGAQDYLVKGNVGGDLLARTLRYAIERKAAEEHIVHLNSVLKAIRNVNQLIVTETERGSLLRKCCDALVDARDYDATWLGSLSDDGTFDVVVGSGFREDITPFSDWVAGGEHPPCIRDALSGKDRVRVIDKTDVCMDCFFKDACLRGAAAVIRVEHADRFFGLLAVSLAPGAALDDEEKGLLVEVASNIGIALHNSEMADARKVAVDVLKESEEKYRTLYNSSRDAIMILTPDERYLSGNVAAVKMFGCISEEDIISNTPADLSPEYQPDGTLSSAKTQQNMAIAMEKGSYLFEWKYKRMDGGEFFTNVLLTRIELQGGQLLQATVRDITERKAAEEALRESEMKYRMLADNTVDCIWQANLDFKFTYVNPTVLRMLGFAQEEWVGSSLFDHCPPDGMEFCLNLLGGWFRKDFESGDVTFEMQLFHKDGRTIDVEISSTMLYGDDGNLWGLQGATRDITKRKAMERALLESEEGLRRVVENMPVMLDAFDDKGNIIIWNSECEKVTGFNAGEIIDNPKAGKMLYPDNDYENYIHSMLMGYGNNFRNLEWDITCKDGSLRTILWSNISEKYPIPGWCSWAIGTDITERKVAEEMLRVAGERFKTIVETAPSILMISDAEGNNVYASPNCEEFIGYDPDELTGGIMQWVHEDDAKRAKDIVDHTFGRGVGCKDFECKAVKKNGDVWYASSSWEPIIDAKGEFKGTIYQTIDITERKAAEGALLESERKYSEFFRTSRDPVFITTKGGGLVESNDALMEALGYETMDELLNIGVSKHYENPDDMKRFNRVVEQEGFAKEFPANLVKKDGSILNTLITATVLKDIGGGVTGFQGTIRDITEHKKAEDQIKRSLQEKEVMLREIHHRVKNNLQVVSSLLNMQARNATDEETKGILSESRDRIITMALIHSQLYEGSDLAEINMKEFVDRLLGQLQSYQVRDMRIARVVRVDDCPFPISVAVPVGLIINELLSNALKHAFDGRDEGKIEVCLTASEGGRINLTVSDDGCGLPPGFDINESKTLGLRLVKILAEDQLQGTLEVTSDGGATFKMEFDITDD